MWIKICANTNLEDALLAAELGADAVGFVFAPSSRQVTAAQVSEITPHLPEGLECVGVFPALKAEEIANAAQESGLNTVQLHGGVSLELIRQLDEIFNGQVRLIQTVHWDLDASDVSGTLLAQQLKQIAAEGLVNRVLIDSKGGAATGGTGVPFDWNAARTAVAEAGAGWANAPIRKAIVPTSTSELASPAEACNRKGPTVFSQRTFQPAIAFFGVFASSCDKATRIRSPRSTGGRAGPSLASDCCMPRHSSNSTEQWLQRVRCPATFCIATPVRLPSR